MSCDLASAPSDFVQSDVQNPYKVDVCRCFPTLSSKLFSNHLSVVFQTINNYVVACFICKYQDVFVVELPEGCPTLSVFKNLSCLMLLSTRSFTVSTHSH